MKESERDLAQEFAQCKDELLRALEYAGGTHTLDDVWEAIKEGKLQLWLGPHSVLVTEVQTYPQHRTLHFFLGGGVMEEIRAMYPVVMAWGRDEMGCTKASLAGRPGWTRSFLVADGWKSSYVVMTKDIK